VDYVVALLGLAVVHLLAVASPGPSTVLVIQTAAVAGRRGGLLAALAMMAGALLWATAALFGLQALFARFEWLYLAFRISYRSARQRETLLQAMVDSVCWSTIS